MGLQVHNQRLQNYKYIKEFSRRTRLDKKVYERVSTGWQKLGLPGVAPQIKLFEDEEIEHLYDGFEKQGNL